MVKIHNGNITVLNGHIKKGTEVWASLQRIGDSVLFEPTLNFGSTDVHPEINIPLSFPSFGVRLIKSTLDYHRDIFPVSSGSSRVLISDGLNVEASHDDPLMTLAEIAFVRSLAGIQIQLMPGARGEPIFISCLIRFKKAFRLGFEFNDSDDPEAAQLGKYFDSRR